MIAAFLKRRLNRFARHYDYDVTYLKNIVDIDRSGGFRLALISPFTGYRFGIPADIYFAAKIRAVRQADCGPCLRLAFQMAQEAGVPRVRLQPVVGMGDPDPDIALVIAYADAVLNKSDELTDIIDQIYSRWGEKGLTGLASAIVAGQFYPMLKRGLGHAVACEPFLQELAST